LWGCGGGTVVSGGEVAEVAADLPAEQAVSVDVGSEGPGEVLVPEVWDGRGLEVGETEGPAPGEAGWPCQSGT